MVRGDYDRETVFGDDPAIMARRWVEEGSRVLHLVDLDGARGDRGDNREAVTAVLAELRRLEAGGVGHVTTELGGGLRDVDAVERWLGTGVDRVILGTVVATDPEVLSLAAGRFPGRVWAGIDARGGRAAVSGWVEDSGRNVVELAVDAERRGAAGIVYTDIDRDGTTAGVNVEGTAAIADAVRIPVYASGGVSSVEDLARLRAVEGRGVAGVVVGRALYEGTLSLAELMSVAH